MKTPLLIVIGLLMILTGCAGSGDYYGDDVDNGPDLYLFGGDFDRGHDVHHFSHRGSESRGAAHHGGSRGAAAQHGGSRGAAHSGGMRGGRR
jgi:hypothetical protein